MPGIDDPIDAVKKQHDEQPDRVLALILDVAGSLLPFAGVVKVIRTHFSRQGAEERTRALLQAIEEAIRDHESSIEDLRERFESPQFVHALIAGVSEAIRTSEQKQIVRYGAVLGHSVAEGVDLDEAAAFIRDLAQLTEADIAALRILFHVQSDLVLSEIVTTDPNPYTERIPGVLKAVDAARLPRDEFYARCSRLSGFGLSLEVQRHDTRMKPGDHCFRLTRRGGQLVQLIADR